MKLFKSIILITLMITLFLIGLTLGIVAYNLSGITTSISDNHDDLGISTENSSDRNNSSISNAIINSPKKDSTIKNIALFGVDTRNLNGSGTARSDSIIVATIDTKNKKIKLSSIMRDTRVAIDNHGMDKVNHAYAYGGPQLAIKTLNQNFGLDIEDFVTVNFFGFIKIIDALGGIELNIKSYEIDELNKFIKEIAKLEGTEATLINYSGIQRLNGQQALAYGRIRKVGNGDYERTQRQRAIILSSIESLKDNSIPKVLKLTKECSSFIKTSLKMTEIIKIGTELLRNINAYTIEQNMFPSDGVGKKVNGVWYMTTDLDKTKEEINDFIYNNR